MGILPQLVVNGLVAGAAYALMAVSFGLIYGSTRFFHFAHGAVYTVAAYGAYFAVVVLRLPMAVSATLAIALAASVGVLSDLGLSPLAAARHWAGQPSARFPGPVHRFAELNIVVVRRRHQSTAGEHE